MSKDHSNLDFRNTEIAFADKTNSELKQSARLFRMMNSPLLVKVGSNLTLAGVKMRLPFVESIIKATVFNHFCGGTSLLDCQKSIDRLFKQNVSTILDYGAERQTDEEDFDATLTETLKALEFAASNESVPCVSTKLTGISNLELLEKIQRGDELDGGEQHSYDLLKGRLETLGTKAKDLGVGIFIDAEESWIQAPIDALVEEMMKEYNKSEVIVYNTYQMYRHDKLDDFEAAYDKARSGGYLFGAKLVRGAYMDKERERADDMGYRSPIHKNKESVDRDYDSAIKLCVEQFESIGSCNASHNWASNILQAKMIEEKGIIKNHPHLNFCQLYGMSDNITFNLADKGYNVAKYLPYGPVKEVVSYLIRRAQENSSVTGDMSREYKLLSNEMERRGL